VRSSALLPGVRGRPVQEPESGPPCGTGAAGDPGAVTIPAEP